MNMCIFEDCGLDAIYCEGHAREVFAPSNVDQEKRERVKELAEFLTKFCKEEDYYDPDNVNYRAPIIEAIALLKEGWGL